MGDDRTPHGGDNAAGDLATLARLWMQVQGPISAYVTANTRDFHHAEDVLQEVGRVVAEKFSEYDQGRSFTAWTLGIARHCLLSHYRDSARDRLVLSEEALRRVEVAVENVSAEGERRRIALRGCMEKLREPQREVLTLRYEEGLGVAAIADRRKTTASTISVTLHRVRRRLLECIERRLTQVEG